MKSFICIVICLIGFSFSSAQIINGDFENWQGGALPGWQIDLTGKFQNRSNFAHSGNSALVCTTQTTNLSSYMFWNASTRYSNSTYYMPLTNKPNVLVGWYSLNGGTGDSMHVLVNIKSGNQIIATAEYISGASSTTYQPFYLPITYTSTSVPDSFQILCGLYTANSLYTAVYFDDFVLSDPLGISTENLENRQPFIFVNNKNQISIQYPPDYCFSSASVTLKEMTGKTVFSSSNLDSSSPFFDLPTLTPGIYLLEYRDDIQIQITKVLIPDR